jgi:peptidoglycan/xylan/chitin deacetylase (PgdA/CDA1 family)
MRGANVYLTIITLFLTVMLLSSCKKDDNVQLLGAGIMLSVDVPPTAWFKMRDFLRENQIKITFYTQSYAELRDSSSKSQIQLMMQDGHEIAHHTSTHPVLEQYLASHTLEEYIKAEITEMSDLMKKDGISPRTFAYPNGNYTTESDRQLLNIFNSLRKTYQRSYSKSLEDLDPIYYRYGNNKILFASSIDRKFNIPLSEIFAALERAKKTQQCICLYCHNVAYNDITFNNETYNIDESALKAILMKAKQLNLTFYTASDISRKKF